MTIYQDLKQLGLFDNITTAAGYRFVFKKTQAKLPQKSVVLDWGSGDGRFTYFLLKNGMNVTAYSIENNLKIESALRTNWPSEFKYCVHQNPRTLPFASETFDAVFSIGVLEHVRETGGNELDSLRELKRVLKPKGKLLCFHLPRKYSWIEYLATVLNVKQYHHTYLYSRRDVIHLLNEAGFRLLEIDRYNVVPRTTLSRLPDVVKNNILFCAAYNVLDSVVAATFPFFAQNIYFMASKE
ncbi:MAG: methyltransferase domain-containing protein [Methanothrix sp.]|nr:methyltransferase domain-containing protein [Methanothrix sp.]